MTIYINHADQADIPAVLRQLARDIENAEIDVVRNCVVAMDGSNGVNVVYCGYGEAGPSAHLLLHKGMQKIAGAK